jgi:ParB family chromosome partitioning protein
MSSVTPTPPNGLAENVVRIAMHPADQFEAFRALVDKGANTADIAARFGVPESTVEKRLKLGRVAPAILDAYRAGELGLEQVQAFTVSDDHEAQQCVWAACSGQRANPSAIRRALTEGEVPSTDPRLCFIGIAAYEEAGGIVRRDLFGLCCKPFRSRSGRVCAREGSGGCRTLRGVTSRVRSCSGRSGGIAAMG